MSSPEASRELGCAGSATGVSVEVRVGALLRLGAIVLIVVDEGVVEVEEGKQGTEGRVGRSQGIEWAARKEVKGAGAVRAR